MTNACTAMESCFTGNMTKCIAKIVIGKTKERSHSRPIAFMMHELAL